MDSVLILVAEDDALVRLTVEEALTEAGFEVLSAASGSEACRLLDDEQFPVKAVVTDIRMGPGPSGWDVARHARERVSGMPIIYVSGDSSGDWSVKGVPKSVMLSKPFALPQLISALAQLLNDGDQTAALTSSADT